MCVLYFYALLQSNLLHWQWRRGECPGGGGGRSHLGDSLLLLGTLSEFHQDDAFSSGFLSLSLENKIQHQIMITDCHNLSTSETGFDSLILFGSMAFDS